MARRRYVEALSRLPALRACTAREVDEIARLVDVIDVPAGAELPAARPGDLLVAGGPTRLLVVDRRVRMRVLQLAPALAELVEESPRKAGSRWLPPGCRTQRSVR